MGLVIRRSRKFPRVNIYDREGRRCSVTVSRVRPSGEVDLHMEGDDFIFWRDEIDPANLRPTSSPACSGDAP